MRFQHPLGLFLLAAGCGILTGPDLEVTYRELAPADDTVKTDTVLSVSGDAGTLLVEGVMQTSPCLLRSASGDRDGHLLTLSINAQEDAETATGCGTVNDVVYIHYEALVLELEPGTYTLRVLHQDLAPPIGDVFNGSVVVR